MNSYQKQKALIAELEKAVNTLHQDLRELVTNPESDKSYFIKRSVEFEIACEKQIMFGDWFSDKSQSNTGNGIAGFIEIKKENL